MKRTIVAAQERDSFVCRVKKPMAGFSTKAINAPMVIDNISFTLLRKFPLATIEFEDIWLGSQEAIFKTDSLVSTYDTLANIEKVYISVKSMPMLKGELEIEMVEIKGVNFNYTIDKHGVSNFDFLIDTTENNKSVAVSITKKLDFRCS